MKIWNLNIKNNPKEICEKLEATLIDRFVFKINRVKNDSVTFKLRKRILYVWYMYFHNWTTVNGKLVSTDTENKTNVEISFTQHWFITLIIYAQMLLGLGLLLSIILGVNSSTSLYILGGILLALGIVLWIIVKKKFEKDIQNYKALINEILES